MHIDRLHYSESHTGGQHVYTFTGPCIFCKKTQTVSVIGPELFKLRQGAYIQDALESNNDDEREFLMSGICGACFDESVAYVDGDLEEEN